MFHIPYFFYLFFYLYLKGINLEPHYIIQGVMVLLVCILCFKRYNLGCIILSYERMFLYIGTFIFPYYPVLSLITVEGITLVPFFIFVWNAIYYLISISPSFIKIPILILFLISNYVVMFLLLYLEISYMREIRKKQRLRRCS